MPGDERSHVSNAFQRGQSFQQKQNRPGTPYAVGDTGTRERARDLQKWETVWLTRPQALVAARSLASVADRMGWAILRAAVMTNHVHAVILGCPLDGSAARRILKGNSQAALSAALGKKQRWWTAGGSDRIRSSEHSIQEAIRYVSNQSGKLAEIIENTVIDVS